MFTFGECLHVYRATLTQDAYGDQSPATEPLVDVVDGCAVDAARALVVRDLIGRHGFTADRYRTLTGPWATVIGPAHPDDPKDGLA